MIDCLSPSPITLPLYIYKSGPALETIDLDCITLSFPQTTSKESYGLASMGGRGENGRAETATLDALDDTSQPGGGNIQIRTQDSLHRFWFVWRKASIATQSEKCCQTEEAWQAGSG